MIIDNLYENGNYTNSLTYLTSYL